jgi:hypothetical protein
VLAGERGLGEPIGRISAGEEAEPMVFGHRESPTLSGMKELDQSLHCGASVPMRQAECNAKPELHRIRGCERRREQVRVTTRSGEK